LAVSEDGAVKAGKKGRDRLIYKRINLVLGRLVGENFVVLTLHHMRDICHPYLVFHLVHIYNLFLPKFLGKGGPHPHSHFHRFYLWQLLLHSFGDVKSRRAGAFGRANLSAETPAALEALRPEIN